MKRTILFILAFIFLFGCSSSQTNNGGNGSGDLPETAPKFSHSPFYYPNGAETDLQAFGIYNASCDCDIVHAGWDFNPVWSSYPDNQVPVVAVADGVITNIVLRSTNIYQGQEHNTYVVWLAVAKEVGVHYTFEPFVTLGETEASQWLNVSINDRVSAGDIIGYLPKIAGNLGDNLIHLDFKVGTGLDRNSYVCPTDYFSSDWQAANLTILSDKITGQCSSICCE